MRSTEFINRVDDPVGERWVVSVGSIPGGVRLQLGEDEDRCLDFVLDVHQASVFAKFLRDALRTDDSVHRSVDLRSDEEIYARIEHTGHPTGEWRMIVSRLGGDVELEVDGPTMHRLVDCMAAGLEG